MTKQETGPVKGYLLLADISGYTAFLTGTELEHAQAIIRELTSLIRESLAPPMRFVKLEGDAVFCYAPSATFANGERFVELVEACYFAYSNRLDDMVRATTCRCSACAAIPTLGLKFLAHFGSFLVERDGKVEDLAGPDVILIHRLLKNTISENGGSEAYLFLTDACLARMPSVFTLPRHTESYESFGDVSGGVHDLAPVLAQMREERREYITAEQADLEYVFDLAVPPPVAWKYFVDPVERQRWACRNFDKNPDELETNAFGRTGRGSKSHCDHGPGVAHREFVDFRPFSYFTCLTQSPAAGGWFTNRPAIETIELIDRGERGTRVVGRMRIVNRGRVAMLTFKVSKPAIDHFFRRFGATLKEVAREDAAALETAG